MPVTVCPDSFVSAFSDHDVESRRVISTPSENAKENLFYLQEAGTLKSLRMCASTRANLGSYLFVIVLCGSGTFTYGGKTHRLKANDCILLDCMQPYTQCSSKTDLWELAWLHFNGKGAGAYLEYLQSREESPVFTASSPNDFTALIANCMELGRDSSLRSEFMISKWICDLLTLCVQTRTADPEAQQMREMREYMDLHLREKLTLAHLAEQFKVSKFYIARAFKKAYGVTVGDYLSMRRIGFAKEQLRFSEKTLEEVADQCGIADVNYFAKVFKKVEGCSPSEYRKKW